MRHFISLRFNPTACSAKLAGSIYFLSSMQISRIVAGLNPSEFSTAVFSNVIMMLCLSVIFSDNFESFSRISTKFSFLCPDLAK
jgi:hypothetical protein